MIVLGVSAKAPPMPRAKIGALTWYHTLSITLTVSLTQYHTQVWNFNVYVLPQDPPMLEAKSAVALFHTLHFHKPVNISMQWSKAAIFENC